MRRRDLTLGLGMVLTSVLVSAMSAPAAVRPPLILDGPSPDVLGLDDVAMASDGTGGVVYRKRVDGHPHVFAARFYGGHWEPSVQVDAGQPYDSAWPAIAASEGGRIGVVWAQDVGQGTDRLYSAFAGPGAGGGFGAPVPVDGAIGEDTATQPSLSFGASSTAYVVYRVNVGGSQQTANSGVPPGYVPAELRLARYKGPRWSGVGRLNRNPTIYLPPATDGNGPRIVADANGQAVAAWVEPDEGYVSRVWLRRIFASGLGAAQQASPATLDGKPVLGGADVFSLAGAGMGEAAVALRQSVDSGAELFATMLPTTGATGASTLVAPRRVDTGAAAGDLGIPAASLAEGQRLGVAFSRGAATSLVTGTDTTLAAPVRLDDGTSTETGDPAAVAGKGATSVVAWRERGPTGQGVLLRETTATGAVHSAALSAPAGGAPSDLHVAGSGLGDALVAFRQGDESNGQIVVDVVDGYPQAFNALAPSDPVRPSAATISWEAADDAIGPVSYRVELDGQTVASGLTGSTYRVDPAGLADGSYPVRVVATDGAGQERATDVAQLVVDGTPPVVRVRRSGTRVLVSVRDVPARDHAGVAATRVTFGDGKRSQGRRSAHRYPRAGRYRIVVHARDRAGNRVTVRRRVRVR